MDAAEYSPLAPVPKKCVIINRLDTLVIHQNMELGIMGTEYLSISLDVFQENFLTLTYRGSLTMMDKNTTDSASEHTMAST